MEYYYIIIAIIVIIGFIAKAYYDSVNDKKRTEYRLRNCWGCIPEVEYEPGKYESISRYYNDNVNDKDIDNITWNDLDMDELYVILNHTESAMGEEVLYSILRKPLYDIEQIKYRDRIIDFFYNNDTDRMKLQTAISMIGRNSKISFYEYFTRLNDVKRESSIYHYLINIVWLIAFALLYYSPLISLTVFIVNIIIAIGTYYRRKLRIDMYYSIFNNLLKMLYCASNIYSFDISEIKTELNELKIATKKFNGFKRNSSIVLNPNGGSIIDIVMDYIRMLTHVDLIKFNSMLKTAIDEKESILKVYEIIGFLDSMIAIASFRKMQEDNGWCVPDIVNDYDRYTTSDIYHPYIATPVYNSFDSDKCALITGSNASGKSTFLKTIAINAIMAQTIATVTAKEYRACCFCILTSMALNDSIFDNKSYYIVEISSLKRIVDCNKDIPVLCCIDEVLRGTNTIERIAASGRILKKLATQDVLCFAATHDIELASILEEYYDNYHFRERIENDNVIFDYKLYKGSAVTRNAINLLQIMGYDADIVEKAKNDADSFEQTGIWSKI